MTVHLTHLAVLHLANQAPQRCSERRTSAGAFAAKWRAPQLSQLVDRLGAPGPPLRGSGSLSGFTHLEAPQEEDAEPGAQPGSETQVSVQHTSFCSKKRMKTDAITRAASCSPMLQPYPQLILRTLLGSILTQLGF